MRETILHLMSSAPVVVTIGLAGIALLLYGDLRHELRRRGGAPDAQESSGRPGAVRGRVVGFALTAVFVVVVVVRFTAR